MYLAIIILPLLGLIFSGVLLRLGYIKSKIFKVNDNRTLNILLLIYPNLNKTPETIKPNKGNIIMAKYII